MWYFSNRPRHDEEDERSHWPLRTLIPKGISALLGEILGYADADSPAVYNELRHQLDHKERQPYLDSEPRLFQSKALAMWMAQVVACAASSNRNVGPIKTEGLLDLPGSKNQGSPSPQPDLQLYLNYITV
jgi:hypothetical protein